MLRSSRSPIERFDELSDHTQVHDVRVGSDVGRVAEVVPGQPIVAGHFVVERFEGARPRRHRVGVAADDEVAVARLDRRVVVVVARHHVLLAGCLVVCPRNDLAVARMWPNGSSNGDSGPNRRNAPEIKRQLVQETHH